MPRKSYLPNDPEDACGYGPFKLPKDHPFSPSCSMHDQAFDLKEGNFPTRGRRVTDKLMLKSMLNIAKQEKSLGLKLQAYSYYVLARAFGKLFW